MYSLDCSYYTAEFATLEELIEATTINGMDPNYEKPLHCASTPFLTFSKNIYKKYTPPTPPMWKWGEGGHKKQKHTYV
jgi:hypothetical protein